MERKRFLIALLIIVLLTGLMLIVTQATEQSRLRAGAEELYRDMEISDIMNNMENAGSLIDIDLDDVYALGEKIKRTDPEILSFLIKTSTAFPFLQDTLLQLAEEYDITVSPKVIRTLLHDEKTDSDVRLETLYYCGSHGKEYQKDIEKLATDEEYGFAALRELYTVDKERAVALSEEIISNRGSTFSVPLDGAMYVLERKLEDGSTPEERIAYIALCETIMAEMGSKRCRDSLLMAIGDIHSYETLSYYIDSEYTSEIDKNQHVYFGQDVIFALLREAPEPEKTAFLTKALYYGPHPVFYDSFKEYITRNETFFDAHEELKLAADKTLAAIEQERIESNLY